jgi:energy-coupling factor transport system permease protein
MELRGFGKNKKRTWIVERPMVTRDYIGIAVGVLALAISIAMMFVNKGRYYNPFV